MAGPTRLELATSSVTILEAMCRGMSWRAMGPKSDAVLGALN